MDGTHAITIDSSPASSSPPSPLPKSYVPSPLKTEQKSQPLVFINSDDASASNSGPGAPAKGKTADGAAKPRKKRSDAATTDDGKPKEKKPRKPRDPNKPTRKKQKVDEAPVVPGPPPVQFPGLITHTQPAAANPLAAAPAQPIASQLGRNEAAQTAYRPPPSAPTLSATPINQPPRPTSSHYDPVRGDIVTNSSTYRSPVTTNTSNTTTQVRASPTLSSLMNPVQAPLPNQSPPSSRPPTSTPRPAETNGAKADVQGQSPSVKAPTNGTASRTTPMEIDSELKPSATSKSVAATTKGNSPGAKAASPKPIRQKQASPPPPLGSGLLSNAAFGKSEPEPIQYAEVPNQCIVIEVPLNNRTGNYVNFMREVEQKYGFDVAHPRLAEHRQRMKQMAVAGAALEPGTGADDMSLDFSEPDSDEDMKDAGGEESAPTDGRKKRRKRANSYNKDDPFIDDTELAWEEHALASNDGYFVWLGPLEAEGEKTTIERADGTAKRGRGRGRGGSTRGETSGRGRGSRGGPGSRGGTTVRKPRITKAERERMEKEKEEREKMAASVTKPTGYSVVA